MEKTINVHITEHHISVITGYKLWLGKESGFNLSGTSSHPADTLEKASSMKPIPDVFVLDYSFDEDDTVVPYVSKFRNQFPHSSLMVVTGYNIPHVIRSLYKSGVDGIITKDNGAGTFIQCLRALAVGGVFYCKTIRKYISSENKVIGLINSLTPMEIKVMTELAKGLTDKDVQEALNLAPSTLDNHRTRLFQKLRQHGYYIRTKAELVNWKNKHELDFMGIQ